MRDEQINRVLQAWKLTEQISGGEVDTKRSQCFVGKISEQAQKAKNDEHSRQKGTSSLIYLGELVNKVSAMKFKMTCFRIMQLYKMKIKRLVIA